MMIKEMVKDCLPAEFQQSYINHLVYPLNLSLNGTTNYRSMLESYKDRFDTLETSLCLENESDVDVPIRDLHDGSGNGIKVSFSISFAFAIH
jgi:hypothetical protein